MLEVVTYKFQPTHISSLPAPLKESFIDNALRVVNAMGTEPELFITGEDVTPNLDPEFVELMEATGETPLVRIAVDTGRSIGTRVCDIRVVAPVRLSVPAFDTVSARMIFPTSHTYVRSHTTVPGISVLSRTFGYPSGKPLKPKDLQREGASHKGAGEAIDNITRMLGSISVPKSET